MALARVDLDGGEYEGTLSPLTRYGTLNTSHARTGSKLTRGKVKGNKRDKPRTSNADVTSECISYTLGADGNPANVRIFKTARKATSSAPKRRTGTSAAATYFDRIAALGATGDVD